MFGSHGWGVDVRGAAGFELGGAKSTHDRRRHLSERPDRVISARRLRDHRYPTIIGVVLGVVVRLAPDQPASSITPRATIGVR